MDRLENALEMLELLLSSKKKRHITGGILISISLLFGGLALTVISLKSEDDNEPYIE